MHRTVTVVAALALAMLLASCAPGPSPAPSATGFASDDEAFAAAEATYRAYVDALNEVDLADPATFEPVYALTTRDLHASEKQTLSGMHAKGLSVAGESRVTRVVHQHVAQDHVLLGACVDVSTITLVDTEGVSQVGADRPAVQSLTVRVDVADGLWRVAGVEGATLVPPC